MKIPNSVLKLWQYATQLTIFTPKLFPELSSGNTASLHYWCVQFVSLHNLQNALWGLARIRIWFRSETCKLRTCDFEIAQRILQIVQLDKAITTLPLGARSQRSAGKGRWSVPERKWYITGSGMYQKLEALEEILSSTAIIGNLQLKTDELTLYRSQVSTGYTLPSRSKLHF